MYELYQHYMEFTYLIDGGMTWKECWDLLAYNEHVADEMSFFSCETIA